MLSSFLTAALKRLSTEESSTLKSPKMSYPTLSFPPPPPAGMGTRSLCARCLTVLSHVITQYGDGTGYKKLEVPHSSSLSNLVGVSHNYVYPKQRKESSELDTSSTIPSCVVCTKIVILFNAARAHISFEASLRDTPCNEWSMSWDVDSPDPKIYPQFKFPHNSVSVLISISHKGGYGWGIGGFKIYPDRSISTGNDSNHKENLGDYPAIVSLDSDNTVTKKINAGQPKQGFSSTLSPESQALVASWAQECENSHQTCNRICGNYHLAQDPAPWFPDRLIQISRKEGSDTKNSLHSVDIITARIVLKSNPSDFSPEKVTTGINYLSLSHCWGPSPNPSAPLGGRAGTVLTGSNLSEWQVDLPLDDLPLAFRHALMTCSSLGFEYMWIDSLCIKQDSYEDWQVQSAVMGDVYKHAWLNVAALSSSSDSEGFINDARDARVEFGFRAPFASILGRSNEEKNGVGQQCILLCGKAKLLWNFAAAIPGCTASNAPLFKRAWVYQERSLARRTLGVTQNSLYWACDNGSKSEQPEWAIGGLESTGLRRTLHSIRDTTLAAITTGSGVVPRQSKVLPDQSWAMLQSIDLCWYNSIISYTSCNLTKHTDKLVAVSSIARELADTMVLEKKYLAGLWDHNLPFQMAWITVYGETTPRRKRVGMEEYVAPSWSWASVEAPVQPRFIFSSGMIALADVHAAEVDLKTNFSFGSVNAGWIRVWGRLNGVKKAERKASSRGPAAKKSTSLTDETTGEQLWFCSDTIEGYELVGSGKGLENMVWTPLMLRCGDGMVECTCLCLIEVQTEELNASDNSFVKQGEKVYRRIGTGNFGRIPSMLRQDKLLMGLGYFPDVHAKDELGQELAKGFKRNECGFEEFVLI